VPVFSAGFGRIFANPRPYSFEYFRMIHKDGRILSFEVNGSPFYDENGAFAGFQGVTRDITKRKRIDD
jgi:PAS domain S-box-containing protein